MIGRALIASLGLLAGCHRDDGNEAPIAVSAAAIAPAAPAPALSEVPFYRSADLTAEWPAPSVVAAPDFHRVAPFSLKNQRGETVTGEALAGRVYLANFFFSSCNGICPKMLANLRRVQAAFAGEPDVLLVSHTVAPASDTEAVLRRYADTNGILDGKWHLLTGPRDAIYDLARRSYFAEKRLGLARGAGEFLHTENMFLIDRRGRIRGVYNATLPADVDRAMDDIRALLGEANRS